MAKKKESEPKILTTLWTFIFYLDQYGNDKEKALKALREVLDDLHLTYVISPLHDKDINADGEPKKPHFHVMLIYSSKKTFEQVKTLTEKLSSPIPQPCNNKVGMIRYFIHIDNPDKAQYNQADIIAVGKVDIESCFTQTNREKAKTVMQILEFCNERGIDTLSALTDYCMKENFEWFNFIFQNTYFIDRVLHSKHSLAREKKQDEREDRRDRKSGILPPLEEPVKVDEKEIESLAKMALRESENIVSKRNKKIKEG
jgi:hypothetical protein